MSFTKANTTKMVKVLKPFADLKVGDVIRLHWVNDDVNGLNDEYKPFAGKPLHYESWDKYHVVESDMVENTVVTLEEMLGANTVKFDRGVICLSDWLEEFGFSEHQFDWKRDDEFEKRHRVEYVSIDEDSHYLTGIGRVFCDGCVVALFNRRSGDGYVDFLWLDNGKRMYAKGVARDFMEVQEYDNYSVYEPGQNLSDFIC